MPKMTKEAVLKALSQVLEPGRSEDIVSLKRVEDLQVEGANIVLQLRLPSLAGPIREELRRRTEAALHRAFPDLGPIELRFSEQHDPQQASKGPGLLPGVEHVIAVSSGKGGVGKSTVSVNLSVALAQSGARVGLLDADIYGPNIPLMMGVKIPPSPKGKKIEPAENHGVRFISMAFFVPENSPMIWRGPMVHGAIQQLFRDVEWGALDYLLIDLPPGTGDAQLSIAQLVSLSGAVIVTTPQEVSLMDSRKGLEMFKKVSVPLLGIVENMSYFECPHCHENSEIFSRGGGRRAAEQLGVPFLGEIPIDPAIRKGGDLGTPIAVSDPASAQTTAFKAIAQRLSEEVQKIKSEQVALKIIQ